MTMGRISRLGAAAGCAFAASVVLASGASASQLVYQPVNPAFGGDPFNGTFLLETARSQNQFSEDPAFPDIEFPDFDEVIVIPPGETDETSAPQVE